MTTFSNGDQETFRKFEHSGWETAANEYHRLWGNLSRQAVARLLDAARIARGHRVLDVATGAGYAAAAAAARGAHAIGLDFSLAQVELARKEYPDVEFVQGDMEELPYPGEHFDAVVMNFGLLHSLRPEVVAQDAFRVLKSGGRFAFTVWAAPDISASFRIVLGAIEKHGNLDIPLPPAQPYFRFSDRQECLNLLSKTGFVDFHFEIVPLVWQLASPEIMFQAFYQGAVRATVILHNQSEQALQAIRPEVLRGCEEFRTGDGVAVPVGASLAAGSKS